MAKGILLEAGTNEMELLVFHLADTPFGINVAKVREIVQRPETIHLPFSAEGVEGSFKLRDSVLTLVSLGAYFGMEGEPTRKGEGMIIIVEFNNICCGVLVDTVDSIHRLRWDKIDRPSPYLIDMNAPITGTAEVDGKTVMIADFETIVSQILGMDGALNLPETSGSAEKVDKSARILLADDSFILRATLTSILKKHGYEDLTVCSDGQEAWEAMEASRGAGQSFDLVLTDIEMPRMDGLHLTNKIKQDPDFSRTPVVLFSSLITEDNRRKGDAVGADAQVSKPNSQEMIDAVKTCLDGCLAEAV